MQLNELTNLRWEGEINFSNLDVDLENKIKSFIDDFKKSVSFNSIQDLILDHRTKKKLVKLNDESLIQPVPDCSSYYVGVSCSFNTIKTIKSIFLEKLGDVKYTMALNGYKEGNEVTEYRVIKISESNDFHVYKGILIPFVTYNNQIGVL